MIYAFNHVHKVGDICSVAECKYARQSSVLAGGEIFEDISMRIVREATKQEYTSQPIPEGWCLPSLEYDCDHIYEVQVLD